MSDPVVWKEMKLLFDKSISAENLKPAYLRTMISGAGPVIEGGKRYSNTREDRTE